MAMGEASSVVIDCVAISAAISAIVICVIEEPVDDATCVGADEFVSIDSNSNDAVSPDVGQLKEVIAEFLAKLDVPEPEFAEPNQRRR